MKTASKYNKSSIMKKAWNLVSSYKMTISNALKQSWKEAKEMPALFSFGNVIDAYMMKLLAEREARRNQRPEVRKVEFAPEYVTAGAQDYYRGAGSQRRYFGD